VTRILILAVLVVTLVACQRKTHDENINITEVDLTQNDDDFVIPGAVWKTLEDAYPSLTEIVPPTPEKEGKKESKPVAPKKLAEDEMFKKRPTVDPLSFVVYLSEKTPGVLKNSAYKVRFGHGGGSLDFKDYLPEDKNGTFFLNVQYGDKLDHKLSKIFYLSNSKRGSGCNKYFEITKYWKATMSDRGLMLNTATLRHIDFMAGTFFFVSPNNGKLRLGHLTVRDSRHPELLCQVKQRI